MRDTTFSSADRDQLVERGLTVEEATTQLGRFRRPPDFAHLVRPATVGDGIESIDPTQIEKLLALQAGAAAEGRYVKFVPASGAASRMFESLLFYQRGAGREAGWDEIAVAATGGDGNASTLVRFLEELGRFPFRGALASALRDRGHDLESLASAGRFRPILDALLDDDGLGYCTRPKGLLPFHRYPDGSRTSFDEHLIEAAAYVQDADGRCRLHLTVSEDHTERFRERLAVVHESYEKKLGATFDVAFSIQKLSTDMLAVDLDDRPLRDADGKLRFRPGGHGSLIENLNDLAGDLVYVKNIDNIQPDRLKPTTVEWKRILGGLLVQIQRSAFASVERLRNERPRESLVADALGAVGQQLHVELNGNRSRSLETRRRFLLGRLDRPIRVCGVVQNTGEPGGGPFWVRGHDGTVTLQIVESAQVDPDDDEQQKIFRSSTHFNPVDLICGLRDAAGRQHDLREFIDTEAVTISRKSADGHELKAQERPGLWNGAMAGWNTVFVEVPLSTFSPVKSVMDLLRPEHQP